MIYPHIYLSNKICLPYLANTNWFRNVCTASVKLYVQKEQSGGGILARLKSLFHKHGQLSSTKRYFSDERASDDTRKPAIREPNSPEPSSKNEKEKKKEKKDDTKTPVLRLEDDKPSEDVRQILHHKWGVKLKGSDLIHQQRFKSKDTFEDSGVTSKLRLTLITKGSLPVDEVYIRRPEKSNESFSVDENMQKFLTSEESQEMVMEDNAADSDWLIWKKYVKTSTKRPTFIDSEVKPVELKEVESISIRPEPPTTKLQI